MFPNATLPQRLAREGKASIFRDRVDGSAGGTDGIKPSVPVTELTAAGASDNGFTLGDGLEGSEKLLWLSAKASTGNAVVTPTNFHNGATLTFDAANEVAHLMFTKGAWLVVSTTATVA